MSKARTDQAWEEGYDDTTYDKQYPDDNTSGGVQLNHNTLYVTNIPKVMNRDGLNTVFKKYGTVTRLFFSYDPTKRFALVTYETPGEAKLAMMKLNKMEPLMLTINVSHSTKTPKNKDHNSNDDYVKKPNSQRDRGSYRDDSGSVSSYGRHKMAKEEVNADKVYEEECYDEVGMEDTMDPDLHLELERLKLEHLKLQEAQVQCKQRMLLLNSKKPFTNITSGANRSILPDGRIIVRNIDKNDADVMGSGAGDSLTIPALQRVSKHSCVVCGRDSELYCSRCELAPYCGQACQRSDWVNRHSAVCHNLVRLSKPKVNSENNVEHESVPPAAPLRKPHSQTAQGPKRDHNTQNYQKHGQVNGESKPSHQNNRVPRNNNYNNNNNTQSSDSKPSSYQNSKPNSRYNHKPMTDEPFGSQKEKTPQARPEPVKVVPAKADVPPKTEAPAPVRAKVPEKVEIPVKVEVPAKKEVPVKTVKPPGSLSDVLPARKIVPKNYLLETISVGDFCMVSTDANASECGTKQTGFVCLCLDVNSGDDYQRLCGEFGELCAQDSSEYTPSPGELFAYYDAAEEGWYRARCLSSTKAALIDSCRVASVGSAAQCRALPKGYETMPEFCCVLNAEGLTLGGNYKATLVSKSSNVCKVALEDDTGASVGEGEAARWSPDVDYPRPSAVAPTIPEVVRPDVTNKSTVLLVDATSLERVLVRPADGEAMRRYDSVLEDVLMYGMTATPMSSPPQAGQTVIARYTDGLHYRALCRRTNVKQDKYMLEYAEYGNIEIANLKNLYPCPDEMSLHSNPTQVSCVKLLCDAQAMTSHATDYLNAIRDDNESLLLTIPNGAETAPTGSEVCLTVVKNKESVNKRVTEMCTPEWKKMEQRGADVLECEPIMDDQITYLAPPMDGCELDVLDASGLSLGTVSARTRDSKHADFVLGSLTERMAEYCESEIGKAPYLPKLMEACIAKCPPHTQWFRAVMIEHKPGEQQASVFFMDCGNIESVSVSHLRKMLPEFIVGVPALALHLEIKDFPSDPTAAQLLRARQHMNIDKDGRGTLRVRRCEEKSPGLCVVDAPELVAAMRRA